MSIAPKVFESMRRLLQGSARSRSVARVSRRRFLRAELPGAHLEVSALMKFAKASGVMVVVSSRTSDQFGRARTRTANSRS